MIANGPDDGPLIKTSEWFAASLQGVGGDVMRPWMAVLVEDDGRLLGAIAVRDELRPEAAAVIATLTRDGYTRLGEAFDQQEHIRRP